MWRTHRSAGVAVACGASGIVVLDGDVRHGARLEEAVAAFGSGILDTVRQRSGGGGWHLFFQAHAALDIHNLHLPAPPGWELIGRGFGVVLYPSIHPSGHRYQWELAPWRVPVLPLPERLVSAATAAVSDASRVDKERSREWQLQFAAAEGVGPNMAIDYAAHLIAKAPEGKRNTTLFNAARYLGSVVADGFTNKQLVRQMLTAAAYSAGLGERETYHTIKSGLAIGAKHPLEEGESI